MGLCCTFFYVFLLKSSWITWSPRNWIQFGWFVIREAFILRESKKMSIFLIFQTPLFPIKLQSLHANKPDPITSWKGHLIGCGPWGQRPERQKVERGFTVITPPHYGVSLPFQQVRCLFWLTWLQRDVTGFCCRYMILVNLWEFCTRVIMTGLI